MHGTKIIGLLPFDQVSIFHVLPKVTKWLDMLPINDDINAFSGVGRLAEVRFG